MAACEKHKKQPVKGYCECPGCEVESLHQRIVELEAPTWTAIADQRPPTMQDVLFAGEHEGKPVVHIGYLSWRDNLYVILTIGRWTPTHWMPLPAPPK